MHHALKRPLPKLILETVSFRGCGFGLRTMASGRTYNDALDTLNGLQTPYGLVKARREQGIRPYLKSIIEMKAYVARLGYSMSDIDRLNVVHVAGTKGKGSTCAFVDSILAQYRRTHSLPRKTGLLISPHLISVRERIRINSAPISEALFAKYFFEVFDALSTSKAAPEGAELGSKPVYARFLTLMSLHVFLKEGVDVAVYETGVGGEYDATNVVEKPVATGITSLGIDHVAVLGDTIEQIAWHKAGIMKTGSPAFATQQVPAATQVLQERAQEKGVDLQILGVDPRLKGVNIRPNVLFQQKNASIAIALAEKVLEKFGISCRSTDTLPKEFVDGLEGTVFRGRCEVLTEDKVTWHLDGAHTADSLKVAAKWFADEVNGRSGPRVLIFNQQQRAEATNFLSSICSAAKREGSPSFDYAIFCTNVTYAEKGYKKDFVNIQASADDIKELTVQRQFAERWSSLDLDAEVKVFPTIEEALVFSRNLGKDLSEGQSVQAFVTGSLHLVGGALSILSNEDAL